MDRVTGRAALRGEDFPLIVVHSVIGAIVLNDVDSVCGGGTINGQRLAAVDGIQLVFAASQRADGPLEVATVEIGPLKDIRPVVCRTTIDRQSLTAMHGGDFEFIAQPSHSQGQAGMRP